MQDLKDTANSIAQFSDPQRHKNVSVTIEIAPNLIEIGVKIEIDFACGNQ